MSTPTGVVSPTDTSSGSPSLPVKRGNSEDGADVSSMGDSSDASSTFFGAATSKRIKLEPEANRRKQLIDFYETAYRRRRDQYLDHVLELFFLEQQGNLMDFYAWRRRAPTIPLLHYLRTIADSGSDEFEQLQLDKARLDSIGPSGVKVIPLAQLSTQLPAPSVVSGSALGTSFGSAATAVPCSPSVGAAASSSSSPAITSASSTTTAGFRFREWRDQRFEMHFCRTAITCRHYLFAYLTRGNNHLRLLFRRPRARHLFLAEHTVDHHHFHHCR
jgi:hypothetical protein